ncbi:hypothetical protein E2C01_076592 [Portunus trituberculatus]|uniref:Uncharacterized protein n=1 Tax=Portunus trituberculatus TaxID=210409 RepID=A0A5B7IBZ6_PORTR|nr:hypothetical protein [Portunus trituberculatus]
MPAASLFLSLLIVSPKRRNALICRRLSREHYFGLTARVSCGSPPKVTQHSPYDTEGFFPPVLAACELWDPPDHCPASPKSLRLSGRQHPSPMSVAATPHSEKTRIYYVGVPLVPWVGARQMTVRGPGRRHVALHSLAYTRRRSVTGVAPAARTAPPSPAARPGVYCCKQCVHFNEVFFMDIMIPIREISMRVEAGLGEVGHGGVVRDVRERRS